MRTANTIWLASMLAVVLAISMLLHSGHAEAEAFGDGSLLATVIVGDFQYDAQRGDRDDNQACKALCCLFCFVTPAGSPLAIHPAEPPAAAPGGVLPDRSILPLIRPPKLSA